MKTRPAGRVLRLLTGIGLVILVGRLLGDASSQLMITTAIVFGAELMFYALLHLAIVRYRQAVNPWLGAILAVTPVAIVYLAGGPAGQLGSLAFVGVSLLVTAARNDAGCEVMTLPGLFLGRRTHLVCIAFSPIDWLEERIFAARGSSALPEEGATR